MCAARVEYYEHYSQDIALMALEHKEAMADNDGLIVRLKISQELTSCVPKLGEINVS